MMKINPIILSGGMGSRLWPMSRIRQPKQFQAVDGEGGLSFFQETVLRHRGPAFNDPVVVASAAEENLLEEQLGAIDADARLIGEPVGRNTGPAVLAAALSLAQDDPGALMLVLPSDHAISGNLNSTVINMTAGAADGRIVVFGIVPRHPETGFGYITAGPGIAGHDGLHEVDSFIEKPSQDLAESLIAEGKTFWASGISLMRADVLIAEFARYHFETLAAVRAALAAGAPSRRGVVLDAEAFSKAENEPTERLIFERSNLVSVAPTDVEWNDVGAWTAVHSMGRKSAAGNVESGHVMCIDTRNSLIRATDRLVTVIGLEGVIIVDTADALLVTDHKNAQRVKEAVSKLKADGRVEVVSHVEKKLAASLDEPQPAAEHVLRTGERMTIRADGLGGTMLAVAEGCARFNGTIPETFRNTGAHLTVAAGEVVSVTNPGSRPLRMVAVPLMQSTSGEIEEAGAEEERSVA